jgi:hypothetical protein
VIKYLLVKQNKTIIFWKAPKIKHTKIKHPHFDRKPPKYPDAKISQFMVWYKITVL